MLQEIKSIYLNIHVYNLLSAAGATKGLRRFGQSIKRVVREVKEESSGKIHVDNQHFLYINKTQLLM